MQVIKPVLNLGVRVVLWHVFPVSEVVELTVQAKELLETCVELGACLPPLGFGDAGTEK